MDIFVKYFNFFDDSETGFSEKIIFNVSNELPKLLIGPLYGNDPTFGVRELLQNAVDSCREREFLEKSEYHGLVKISIYSKEEKLYFEIKDNGLLLRNSTRGLVDFKNPQGLETELPLQTTIDIKVVYLSIVL